MAVKVFVDFDGTITRRDVGNAFFEEFGGAVCKDVVAQYKDEQLSAQECFRREVAAVGKLDRREAVAFLKRQPIDETIHQLLAYCRAHQMDFFIVSDGLDFHISELLTTHNISQVPFFANALRLEPTATDGQYTLSIEFPYSDAECTRCACCKRNIMLTHAGEDDVIVLVGEGYSDRCPARYADVVFAKDELQAFCQAENISYFTYRTLGDVAGRLEDLRKRNGIRKRRIAELRRREAFMRE